jgi:hypothetical protein
VTARYLNEATESLCRCDKNACPPDWARPCIWS